LIYRTSSAKAKLKPKTGRSFFSEKEYSTIFFSEFQKNIGLLPMRCHRCQGWMVQERFYGPGLPFLGWRCVHCGEILDPLIWENRIHGRKSMRMPNGGVQNERGKGR
jgi:hypothetical protein